MRQFDRSVQSLSGINLVSDAGRLVQPDRRRAKPAWWKRAVCESLEERLLLYALVPSQVTQAYGINQIKYGTTVGNGAGQTIAIIDHGDDSALVNTGSSNFASSDLHTFDHMSGINLPDPPSFTVIGEPGVPVRPKASPDHAVFLVGAFPCNS